MFNEKATEWSNKQAKEIPVWQSPKYLESRKKAKEIIDSGKYGIDEADFWILMNETKSGKMAYTGLIISHNGCLKVNDGMDNNKFRPECVSINENGWGNSLVYTYSCAEQGLYEVGEVSAKNCKIDYPYAMALKRMFDRVVLKLSKLAYAGIYGEDEADEFRNPLNETEVKETAVKAKSKPKAETKAEPKPETPKEADEKQKLQDRLDAKVKSLIQNQGGVEFAICENCGGYIYKVAGTNGTIEVPEFCAMGLKRFGKAVCKNCFEELHKQKAAK